MLRDNKIFEILPKPVEIVYIVVLFLFLLFYFGKINCFIIFQLSYIHILYYILDKLTIECSEKR